MSEQEIKRMTPSELRRAFQTVTGKEKPADLSRQERHDLAAVAKYIHDVMIYYSIDDFAKIEGGLRIEYLAWPEGLPLSLPDYSRAVRAAEQNRQANRHARRAQAREDLQKARAAGHA